MGALLESELQKGGEDFTLLEQMNLVTTAKYRCAAHFDHRCGRGMAPAYSVMVMERCLLWYVCCSEMAQYASGLVAILDKLREKRASGLAATDLGRWRVPL